MANSLLLTRNCFGSRTAWLLPDLNTLALAITPYLPCIRYTPYALPWEAAFLASAES